MASAGSRGSRVFETWGQVRACGKSCVSWLWCMAIHVLPHRVLFAKNDSKYSGRSDLQFVDYADYFIFCQWKTHYLVNLFSLPQANPVLVCLIIGLASNMAYNWKRDPSDLGISYFRQTHVVCVFFFFNMVLSCFILVLHCG